MSGKRIHEYFDRTPAKWGILGFLNECDIEPILGLIANLPKIGTTAIRLDPRFIFTIRHFLGMLRELRPSTMELPTSRRRGSYTRRLVYLSLQSELLSVFQWNWDYKDDIDTISTLSDHGEDEDSEYEAYNENEEDDVGESSTSEGDDSFKANTSFVKTYKDMDPTRKWVLSSGMIVEDVIFRKYKNMSMESLTHSWVIDLDNHEVTSLFSPADWKEISSQTLSLPQLDILMAKSVSRFARVMTTSGLREILETTSYRSKDEPYDHEKHYDAEWVDLAMRRMLPLFKSPDQLLRKSHLEGWYDSNIWSFIVDYALQDLKGMETVPYVSSDRFESSSLATTMRKNRKRVRTGTKDHSRIGRRLDAISRLGRAFGVKSTKWLIDKLKLAKTLHDMLFWLEVLVDHQDSLVKKLQVVGLVNSGLKCQVL
ncbi:hypothetical protein BC938DRAFT_483149 [Jimgerdemannia flammicorona]|uniref:Uncharacterized protein n=1 Tax=Jimgerdemannia flammicorona TaxID=994334 RepID=A0A433QCJ6_9FUNG|nr:hypothetical protein BC938DRAFT_483149 [Jimgerdemannia flammicorona]